MTANPLQAVATAARRVLAHRPSGICADIDGTLSPIVELPEAAFVPEPIKQSLAELAVQLDVVAAVTGRAVADARRLIALDTIGYVGNHGIERWRDGHVQVHPLAEAFSPRLRQTLDFLRGALPNVGLIFEDKGATASIHYRLADDSQGARNAILAAIDRAPDGAEIRIIEGRMVVNLLPPLRLDKGRAIEQLVEEYDLGGVVFLGDDVTDLDAFRALRKMRLERGLETLSVAVISHEVPPEVAAAADVRLNGVVDVGMLLVELAADPFGPAGR